MERVLLWASVVVGLLVYLCRYLPVPRTGGGSGAGTPSPETPLALHAVLRAVALAAPVLGLLVTLPTRGLFFAEGQRFGFGFLLGGAGALLASLSLLRGKREADTPEPLALASTAGVAAAATALALLFLRASLLDALMGVAAGWFCAAFALLLALPAEDRAGVAGRRLSAGAGIAAALPAAALLGVFRDPLTPALAKLTWSATLTAFAALGALFVAGATLVPGVPERLRRTLPLFVLVLAGGLALFQMAVRMDGAPKLLYAGFAGLLLWPVALAVLRAGPRRTAFPAAMPALAVLVVASGFLASLQAFQGVGAAGFVVALWLAYAATAANEREPENANAALSLALFGTVLLLWRAFTTRWAGDLRGVTLTDQYALFGLLVGAALPGLLAAAPARWRGQGATGDALLPLAWCALLSVAALGAALLLFGPKSAAALLLGLALGAVQPLGNSRQSSSLPALLAVAVALALDQFTGPVLNAVGAAGEMTRMDRLRWLGGLMAVVAVLAVAADRDAARQPAGDEAPAEEA